MNLLSKIRFFFNNPLFLSLLYRMNCNTFVMQTEDNDLNNVRMKRAIAQRLRSFTRRFTVLTGLLFVLSPCFAQGWEVAFGGDSEDQGVAIIQTVDEGYIEVGFSESFGSDGDFDIYLVRTDVDGTLLWANTYDGGYIEQPGDIIQLSDESFLIAGHINDLDGTPSGTADQFYLMQVSARGDLLWERRYENDGIRQRAHKIIPTSDGGYMLIGLSGSAEDENESEVMLLKLDSNADEEWRETYGTPYSDDGVDVVEVTGGYIFVANLRPSASPNNDIGIYHVNDLGVPTGLSVYGTSEFSEDVHDLIQTQDGNLVLVGSSRSQQRAYVLKSDLNGDTLWTREIDAGLLDDVLASVIELEDGSLVAVGQTAPNNFDVDILLLKLSADGDLIWTRKLGEEFEINKFGEDIAPASDGGFVIAGYSGESDQIFINDLVIVKVDDQGNYLTNMLTGKVFWSTDGCNPYEEGDQPLEGWLVRVDGSERSYIGSTNANGNFYIPVDTGSYQVTLLDQNTTWSVCSPASFPIDFTTTYDTLVYNFPVRKANECPYLEVEATTSALVSCAQTTYVVEYSNLGSGVAGDAYIEIFIDDEFTYVGASIDSTQLTNNSLIFELGDLAPLQSGSFELYLDVACEGILDGQAAFVNVHIYPDSICAPLDPNWDMASLEVSGECIDNQISFKVRNTGTGTMGGPLNYIITEDVVVFIQDQEVPPLGPGAEHPIAPFPVNEDGSTYRLIVQQSEGHPGNSFPTIAIEGCATDGIYTTGHVTQFPEDDQDAFVDIDVQEIYSASTAIEMRGHPRGYLNEIITPSTDIEYVVFFANTGPDTLSRLVIRDTLPSELDASTLEVGPASHPYDFELYDNGVLKITFDNLELLPDGSGAEADTRGYVKFTLSQKLNLPLGSVIENKAAVYFDYVAPVQTNVVRHVVDCENYLNAGCLLVNTDGPHPVPGIEIKVLPNPFSASAQFIIEGCSCEEVEMILRDAQGRLVRREVFQGSTFTFHRNKLASAVYFYELQTDGMTISTGKLLVQ